MAVRSIWNGTVAFGTVVVPVKLFSAVQEHSVHFHEVLLRDGWRIVHRRVGSESGREVPDLMAEGKPRPRKADHSATSFGSSRPASTSEFSSTELRCAS
jgi:hypothetical protein